MPRARVCFALSLLCACLSLLSCPASARQAPTWMWIWASDAAHPPETLFFRQRFRLPRAPLAAKLRITADDSYRAYLNEGKIPVAQGNDWTTVQEFDVTRQLKAGENLLAVEATNTDGSGGLLYKISIQLPGGKTQTIVSNAAVRVNRRVPPAWLLFATEDSRWTLAKEVAPAGGGVWGQLRGAPVPDPTRLVRLWDIRAGGTAGEEPYRRTRNIGDRMILSASVSSLADMKILAGAGFTLFQTDSNHLSTEETKPNVWDWKRTESARKAVQGLQLDWCYFPHYAFPPDWFRQSVPFTRIECLEHRQPAQAFSPWDPTWKSFIDRGYEALANQFGRPAALPPPVKPGGGQEKLSAIDVGVHGDYGDAGLLTGARMRVESQRQDWIQRFGDEHDHLGYWCNDPLARADFRDQMLHKYGDLAHLNAAWKRNFASPDAIDYPEKPRAESRQEWLDFITWYQEGVGRAVEANLSAARKHFPDTLLMLPVGFSDENPRIGNDNSLQPKLAAKYRADVRSTHGGFKPFADNAATMLGRLGSASRFYGAPFWTEPPGALTADQEVERIFEAVSQGAKGYFDWTGNAVAHRDVYYRYGKYLRVEKPVTDVAMFYPAMAQKLRPDQGYAVLFARACADLRDAANFDIVDDRMVLDGCLSRYRILALWEGTLADQATLDKIKAWVNDGGVLLAYDFGKVTNFQGDTSWFTDMFGYVQELAPASLSERYVGTLPTQYRLLIGEAEAADYLGDDWLSTVMDGEETRRWASAKATVHLPVDPDKRYNVIVRATVPEAAADLSRRVLFNGHEIGRLGSPGDVTYRFLVPADALGNSPIATLTFQSETFQPSKLLSESKEMGNAGALIYSVTLIEQNTPEAARPVPLPGALHRELDLRKLNTDWARRYGKGLTIYFPANRQLIKGYIEVLRRAIYHLRAIDPENPDRRDALLIDDALDGVYATLFTDKILFYNPKDKPVTKTVTIPPEAFAAWRGEVTAPTETSWKLTIEPHGINAIYFTTPPQELLLQCEEFTDLGTLKPFASEECSPGKGPTCVRLAKGASITTRFPVDVAGRYAIYTRCIHDHKPEAVEVLVDGQPLPLLNTKAGQTLLSGIAELQRGTHMLTLRARADQNLLADFILLTNDATIAGYDFAIRTTPVD